MEGIRRALVRGLVLIAWTAMEQDPSVGPLIRYLIMYIICIVLCVCIMLLHNIFFFLHFDIQLGTILFK